MTRIESLVKKLSIYSFYDMRIGDSKKSVIIEDKIFKRTAYISEEGNCFHVWTKLGTMYFSKVESLFDFIKNNGLSFFC